MPTASKSPGEFVDDLVNPGLWIVPMSKWVSLKNYLCPVFGKGVGAANVLKAAISAVAKGTPDYALISKIDATDFSRVFTGQGKPEHISMIMHLIWYQKDAFAAYKDPAGKQVLAKYFSLANPLQGMVEDGMFGYDCIGFAGRYFEDAGVFNSYPAMYPRHYLDRFFPVQSVGAVAKGCVVVWVNGTHIGVIDSVVKTEPEKVTINFCQGSGGGPQTNRGVELTHISQSSFLEFGAYGREVDTKPNITEDERKEIQQKYKKTGTAGYRSGIFFNLTGGDPIAPVTGTVYVGKMPELVTNW